jgi:hypothetical protein
MRARANECHSRGLQSVAARSITDTVKARNGPSLYYRAGSANLIVLTNVIHEDRSQ